MGMPKETELAPDFTLPDQDGQPVALSALRGRKVILYFYPRDDTPGCTKQACGLRDEAQEIEARGAVVLGVSPDDVESHRRFADRYGLPFTLLADEDHAVAELYGVWQQKSFMGRKYMGVVRTTFVIAEDGRIEKVLEKVKPAAHARQILQQVGTTGAG
jgi:thioredoxin-dependent peroxiredoxin